MHRFQPKDVIAVLTLLLLTLLKLKGLDGIFDTAAALILGYYFAHRRVGRDPGQ